LRTNLSVGFSVQVVKVPQQFTSKTPMYSVGPQEGVMHQILRLNNRLKIFHHPEKTGI
jgi:hypothetical protein